MKLIIGLILSTGILCTAHASEIRSKSIKKTICSKIVRAHHVLKTKECLSDSLTTIHRIVSTKKIELNSKKYTSVMHIASHIKGSVFTSELSRSFTVSSEGVVTANSWIVSHDKKTAIIGNFHFLMSIDINDGELLEELSKEELSRSPESVRNFSQDLVYSDADYDDDYKYSSVLRDGKHIGYIAYRWFESEEDDIKGYEEAVYDIDGVEVFRTEESFGFYE